MIVIYWKSDAIILKQEISCRYPLPEETLWIDLVDPTEEEERYIEASCGINVPTRKEMWKMEAMSRFSEEKGIIFMTATVVSHSASQTPENDTITLILTDKRLITCRYSKPIAFEKFSARLQRSPELFPVAEMVLSGLLDAIVTRLAEIIERVSEDLDELSHEIFTIEGSASAKLQDALKKIGRSGELSAKINESLHSASRLIAFSFHSLEVRLSKEQRSRYKNLLNDVQALREHATFLTQEINFLLTASLGLISVQQNAIIKIFSVASVIFLPPTVIASMYGMNFQLMPELSWTFGYPFAIVLMIFSAIVPYRFFKKKGWL